MDPKIYKLFVYGSLRSGFHNPVYNYLTRYFHLCGEALVKGKLFDKGEYPVALPSDEDKFITGELYELNNPEEFDWIFEQLDDYEGLHVEKGEAPLYKRESVTVYQKGTETTAWVYWYNQDIGNSPELTIGDVLLYLQQKNKP